MSLNLTVPALDDAPLIHAETRPQKLLDFIAGLPGTPLEAAAALTEEMEILNRQKVVPDGRFRALEIYRTAARRLIAPLTERLRTGSLPLTADARAAAGALESLWLELAYGYKLTLIDQLNQLFGSGNKPMQAASYRAIEALHQLSLVYYQTYFGVPGNVWRDMHQLYFHAVQHALHNGTPTLDDSPASIELLYKRALLLALADPRHLSVQDIELSVNYIERHARLAQLTGLGTPIQPDGIFIVDLGSDQPPLPYVKNLKKADSDTDILLVTIDLARAAHRHLEKLQAGSIPDDLALPGAPSAAHYRSLLAYLVRHWGTSPKRIYRRSNKNSLFRLAIGIDAVLAAVEHERQAGVAPDGDHPRFAPNADGVSSWQALNVSAGGTALRHFAAVAPTVHIGDLIGIRRQEDKNWSIAVLRWAMNGEQGQLDIGVELIAPGATAVTLAPPQGAATERALLLPAVAAVKQAASLIVRRGTHTPARVLDVHENGATSPIMLTRLLERSENFERALFSQL